MNAKRRRWLEFHDQKTGGIMGLLPLIKGLPVRLTDHIDRNLGLYKQTKCTIHGWTLNVNEAHTLLVARTHLIHRMCLSHATHELFLLCSRIVELIFHVSISARCPTSIVLWDVRREFVSFSSPKRTHCCRRTSSTLVELIVHALNNIHRSGVYGGRIRASVGFAARFDLPDVRERQVARP